MPRTARQQELWIQAIATVAFAFLALALAAPGAHPPATGRSLLAQQAEALHAQAAEARAWFHVHALAPTATRWQRLQAAQLADRVNALARELAHERTGRALEPQHRRLAALAGRLAATLAQPAAPAPTLAAFGRHAAAFDRVVDEVETIEDSLVQPALAEAPADRPPHAMPAPANARTPSAPPTPPPQTAS
jgi:hypothetical protein